MAITTSTSGIVHKSVDIAVIGGGPKAAAIAAKAWVLQQQNKADVRVTIFEPLEIGAFWSGKGGYTDGEQRLCTIAERDLGFPYNATFDRDVHERMASEFSWATFLHARPTDYESDYGTWVDSGRKPPLHRHFADYLQWTVAKAGSRVIAQRVTRLTAEKNRWRVSAKGPSGSATTFAQRFDAVVVSGPGPARSDIKIDNPSGAPVFQKIFNGQDFWQRLQDVRAGLQKAINEVEFSGSGIAIVGAGGTAAAILAWLIDNGAGKLPIEIVASQASLHTRVDSVFENRLFSDDEQWATLSSQSRRAFFDRLNRGVVWATVIDRVSSARDLKMVDGRAQGILVSSSGEVTLAVRRGDGKPVTLQPAMLIDCSGFDPWWFLSLLSGLPTVQPQNRKRQRDRWQEKMGVSLQLQGRPWGQLPPLHAPMLASELGPGFGSLMVLGAMADRVLAPYCPDALV
jgi:mycobactin lysine-N-oxygenase